MEPEGYRTSARARIEKICADVVRSAVNAQLGEDGRTKRIGRSLYSYLLQEMAKAASDYALKENIEPFDFEHVELGRALDVVYNLRSALVRDWTDKSLDFWDSCNSFSYNSPIDKIKAGKVPYIDRSSLETVVGEYLGLPYRSPAMDRLLVDVLIAMELYAYGDEMLNEKTFGLSRARSRIKHGAFFAGVVAALAFWASSKGWVSESSALWTLGVCVFLFLLTAVIRQRIVKLLSTMAAIYDDLRSDGPISAKYIRDRANNAAQEGVVWPAPLFALLDDIISRTGRF